MYCWGICCAFLFIWTPDRGSKEGLVSKCALILTVILWHIQCTRMWSFSKGTRPIICCLQMRLRDVASRGHCCPPGLSAGLRSCCVFISIITTLMVRGGGYHHRPTSQPRSSHTYTGNPPHTESESSFCDCNSPFGVKDVVLCELYVTRLSMLCLVTRGSHRHVRVKHGSFHSG